MFEKRVLTCFMFYAPLGNIRICEYTPPLMTSHSKKCPGDLEELDLGGNFRICEYTPPPDNVRKTWKNFQPWTWEVIS